MSLGPRFLKPEIVGINRDKSHTSTQIVFLSQCTQIRPLSLLHALHMPFLQLIHLITPISSPLSYCRLLGPVRYGLAFLDYLGLLPPDELVPRARNCYE